MSKPAQHCFIEIGDDLEEVQVGTTKAKPINLARALVLFAEKRYGKGNWKLLPDPSMAQYRAVANDGRCLSLRFN